MIYLIYGENEYLINKNINKIINDNKNLDVVNYDMTMDNISTALDDALTPSLFSTDKIIVCYNSVFLTSEKCDIDHDIEYLNKFMKIESNTILIITINKEIDKRKKITKDLLKTNAIECNNLKDYELISFVKDYCKTNKFKIDDSSIKLFLNKLDNNLYIITNELDKLFLYTDKVITKEDVELCTSNMIKTDIFELINALTHKNIDLALTLYDDLLLINEEEIKLIITLANQFRLIYQTKTMKKSGLNDTMISQELGVHPYRVKLANELDISEKESLSYLEKLSNLDKNIKLGLVDKKNAFKEFILTLQ